MQSIRVKTSTVVEGALTLGVRQRELNRIISEALMELGDFHAENWTETHFIPSASAKYGYAPRKGEGARPGTKLFARVAGPEEKRVGEIRPLVYSGELQRLARAYRLRTKATSNEIRLDIIRPRAQKANWRPSKARQINMRKELTSVSPHEESVARAFFTRVLHQKLLAVQEKLEIQRSLGGGI